MKRIFTLTILAAALVAGGLHAQAGYYDPEPDARPNTSVDSRWSLVTYTAEENLPVYIDTETLQYRPSAAEAEYAWVWVNFIQKNGSQLLARYQIHRTNGHMRVLSAAVYGANRELVWSDYKPQAWQEYAPGSVGELVQRRVFPRKRRSDV